jgi:hypothetical protein
MARYELYLSCFDQTCFLNFNFTFYNDIVSSEFKLLRQKNMILFV